VHGDAAYVVFVVVFTAAVVTLYYARLRRRRHPQATVRSWARDMVTAVAFMGCRALAGSYPRLRWMHWVVFGIAAASSLWRLVEIGKGRARRRRRLPP
jgi:hypothetical protein